MATVEPKPPRVVWEAEVKERGWRTRIVESQRQAVGTSGLVTCYVIEVARERDAMGAWCWDKADSDDWAAIKVAVAALGSRCGCEGEKAEVSQ